jgi:hypothetical protein
MADDSAAHADELEELARRRFGDNLSEAEKRLLRAAPKAPPGSNTAVCGPNFDDKDAANDPAKADDWGSGRAIRAELIRWLCIDEKASKKVDPRGVWVYAAKIAGKLDLSFATVPFPLRLSRCRLVDGGELENVTIPALYLEGSSTGALNMDRAEVKGSVLLDNGFSAAGEVRLINAKIGGELGCKGASVSNPGGYALVADGVEVGAGVFLDGLSSVGEVRLVGAKIGGELGCIGATFKNPGGDALNVQLADVKGSVFLKEGFSAEGTVDLLGTQVRGSLDCVGGKFRDLVLDEAVVKGAFLWAAVPITHTTQLELTNASVGAIVDNEASWPERGNLFLDGFVYERITVGPTDARARLEWLGRQGDFKPQPYQQLAKVLREMGDDDGAKQILFELEKRARAEDRKKIVHAPLRCFRLGEDAVSDAAVGYGIYPGRAVWWACGLAALGWIVHRRAGRMGAMAPTEKDAYDEFSKGQAPDHYQPFNPLIYSIENCIPLVKLGQDDLWRADPHPQTRVAPVAGGKFRRAVNSALDAVVPNWTVRPVALRWFRWIMIGLGWLLATFFGAALTGFLKSS